MIYHTSTFYIIVVQLSAFSILGIIIDPLEIDLSPGEDSRIIELSTTILII